MSIYSSMPSVREWPLPSKAFDPHSSEHIKALATRFGSPLFVIDLNVIRAQYRALKAALPMVDLHYALKPLPQVDVVQALKGLDASFDIATKGEIGVVRQAKVDPKRCIHTHPIKTDAEIREAIRYGIDTFVVDNVEEAAKFRRYRQKVKLLIRLRFPAKDAVCDLSKKFGLRPEAVPAAWEQIRALSIPVAGFSFHVGSQTPSSEMTVHAIDVVRSLCREAPVDWMRDVEIIDIGGGFPVGYSQPVMSIDDYARPIVKALANLPPHVRILAEPGRFIAAPAGTVITSVVGRAKRDGVWWYYLDDGVYGCFNGRLYDHARYPISSTGTGPVSEAVLAGPTCDSIDVIESAIPMPELEIGEWVVGHVMGAYTHASSSEFNSIPKAKTLVLDADSAWVA